MDIDIVEMTPADYDETVALWQACEGVYLGEVDDREHITDYLRRNPGLSFIAREDGNLVGAVLCGTDGRGGYLRHLSVAESHRKSGLGRTLADRCLSALREAGIGWCQIVVLTENEAGRTFWQRTGWKEPDHIRLMSKLTDA